MVAEGDDRTTQQQSTTTSLTIHHNIIVFRNRQDTNKATKLSHSTTNFFPVLTI
jgi:hypothetical protein